MSSAAVNRKRSRSASAIVSDTASGYHVLRIYGYSRTKGTPTGEHLKSVSFTVGGHRWYILYYPNGKRSECADYISLFLRLADDSGAKAVKAQFSFILHDDAMEPTLKLGPVQIFENQQWWGQAKFIKREDLEKSKYLHGDSFAIRCDVIVITEIHAKEETPEATTPEFVSVAPSDLHQHLGDLLQTEKGADVVFSVGGQTFSAHRCVLAARSPVFSAELYSTMREGDTGCVVRIDDMEAGVFKALLRFIYTDVFPEVKKEGEEGEEEDVISQHLLVAADRYNLNRLKQICEQKLCKYIDATTVENILALADQHHCPGLKKACFHFLSSPANLKAAMSSTGFDHLSKSCPSVMKELVTMIGNLVQ